MLKKKLLGFCGNSNCFTNITSCILQSINNFALIKKTNLFSPCIISSLFGRFGALHGF